MASVAAGCPVFMVGYMLDKYLLFSFLFALGLYVDSASPSLFVSV